SSRREYAQRLLTQHGLLDRFEFILASEGVTRGKPDPEIYSLAAEGFAVPASSVLVLEDSPAGLAAAKGAGAFAVGVPHEHSTAQALHDADMVVSRLDEPGLLGLQPAVQRLQARRISSRTSCRWSLTLHWVVSSLTFRRSAVFRVAC